MKIEKINENQIRCTLSSADLSSRNIRLAELAYGSDKANGLFREMMEQASDEVGFEPDDNPLMIEAIPLSPESIMLIITKIDDPEELDTRFSRFSPTPDEELPGFSAERLEGADTILNLLSHAQAGGGDKTPDPSSFLSSILSSVSACEAGAGDTPKKPGASEPAEEEPVPLSFRVFSFPSLDRVMEAARACSYFDGSSTLYKNPSGRYYLAIREPEKGSTSFMRACNQMSEYGSPVRALPVTDSYYEEHYETLIADEAVSKLAKI